MTLTYYLRKAYTIPSITQRLSACNFLHLRFLIFGWEKGASADICMILTGTGRRCHFHQPYFVTKREFVGVLKRIGLLES